MNVLHDIQKAYVIMTNTRLMWLPTEINKPKAERCTSMEYTYFAFFAILQIHHWPQLNADKILES